MADLLTLKKSYLREAATGGRTTVEQQLAWLEGKRSQFQAEVDAGDWEVQNQGRAGRTTSALRKLTAGDRLAAVLSAIEDLESTNGGETSGGGSLLSFRIHGIQS